MTYVALEGLGNRLRSHLMAHAYALRTGRTLIIDWAHVQACNASFGDLFELGGAIERRDAPLRSAYMRLIGRHSRVRLNGKAFSSTDGTIDDVPDYRSLEVEFGEAFNPYAFERAGAALGRHRGNVLSALRPKHFIRERVAALRERLGPNAVGVHIRRGDFWISFPNRIIPIENYLRTLHLLQERTGALTVYLATDDPEAARPIVDNFECVMQEKSPRAETRSAMQVFGYDNKCNRDTIEGVSEAVVDLYTLGTTELIVGSDWSSFSYMASLLGSRPLIIPRDPERIELQLERSKPTSATPQRGERR